MAADSRSRCPVCRASFRGTRQCSRCGADLAPVMALSAKAYFLREAAREATRSGDFTRGRELVQKAQGLQATDAGRKLELLLRWARVP